ncbi:MarR family winged helix-turn-helix transcriptional regulator [Paraburkholderia xenovorans]|uniref:MarR family winged helix-turn-helix transcriptional regulator n=1 Tax=Paraburkholderia xenovorans TaxID=36873 RepID=UPI0038BCEB1E
MAEFSRRPGEVVLKTCTCLTVRQASRAVSQFYDEMLTPVEISSGQFTLLAQIKLKESSTISALAQRLLIERTTLTRNVRLLQERGLVEVVGATSDKRQRMMNLTAQGELLLVRAFPSWDEAQTQLSDALGKTGWNGAIKAMEVLIAGVAQPELVTTVARVPHRTRPGRSAVPDLPGRLTQLQLQRLRSQLCMCTSLRRCVRTISKFYDDSLRPLGVKISQLHIIAAVGASPGTRITDFVEMLTLDQTTLTRMFQRLSELGLVTQHRPESQKRGVWLTTSGEQALKEAFSGWKAAQAAMDAILTEANEAHVGEAMSAILNAASSVSRLQESMEG